MDPTNRYRRPDHRAAYERALALAAEGLDYWQVARQLDPSIRREKRRQIAAKAVRVARRRERKDERRL